MTVKVTVNFDTCISSGTCADLVPQVFELRDDGFLYVINAEPGEDLREALDEAAEMCPTNSITIEG